jgi:hypothetical protein
MLRRLMFCVKGKNPSIPRLRVELFAGLLWR